MGDDELSKLRERADTCSAFLAFVEEASLEDGDLSREVSPLSIAEGIRDKLLCLREEAEQSAFVRDHEFIGSSVLIVADADGNVGVSWIDFAKTCPAPEGTQFSHREPWVQGNHEDGILTGLDNLIDCWSSVAATFSNEGLSSLTVEVDSDS